MHTIWKTLLECVEWEAQVFLIWQTPSNWRTESRSAFLSFSKKLVLPGKTIIAEESSRHLHFAWKDLGEGPRQ